MKNKISITAAMVFFLFVIAQLAHADLNSFLIDINKKAISDITHFHSTLSKQFGVPVPNVEKILKTVPNPADAFMCFQLSKMTGIGVEDVARTFNHKKGKGWGAVAKELGIKPGSREFHALKEGNFVFGGGMDYDDRKSKKNKKSKKKKKDKKNKKK